jgi:hypothetical protein
LTPRPVRVGPAVEVEDSGIVTNTKLVQGWFDEVKGLLPER